MALTLNTLHDTLAKMEALGEEALKDILVFNNNDVTSDTAKHYIDMIADLREKIDRTGVPDTEKKKFTTLFNAMISNMCSAECKGLLLSEACSNAKELRRQLEEVIAKWQKERDDNNQLRAKHNETLKAQKVEVPAFTLSVCLKGRKPLTNEECVGMMAEMRSDNLKLNDQFKRVSVPEEVKDKVSRAYAKASEVPAIVQKPVQRSMPKRT